MSELDIGELLHDVGWLRTLARRLARDVHVADDLVQETCTIALRQAHPPRRWRPWLAGVLKNLFRAHARDRMLRRQHATLPAHGASEDAETLLQRAETQQLLVAVVLGLEEPYRSTVLLRFFEGLPPRGIAVRHGVPVATVHSRLQRAMHRLREDLDARPGGRSRWLAMALPIAWPRAAAGAPLHAAARTYAMVRVAAVVASVAAIAWWGFDRGGAGVERAVVASTEARTKTGVDLGAAALAASPTGSERVAVEDPAAASTTFAARGRVFDVTGAAVAAVSVLAEVRNKHGLIETVPVATTDADGHFTGELAFPSAVLFVRDDRYQNALSGKWSNDRTDERRIVVAPAISIGGRLFDAQGWPLTSGDVALEYPDDLLMRPGLRQLELGTTLGCAYQTSVAADGTFRLSALPRVPDSRLWFRADGHEPTWIPLPAQSTDDLRIVLGAITAVDALRGVVSLPDGTPAAGALVASGVTSVRADREGRFAISLRRIGRPTDLVAALPGCLPARLPVPSGGGKSVDEWPQEIVLELGGLPASIEGRVVDANGPVVGAEVWIDDPTPFAVVGIEPILLEYYLAGAPLQYTAGRPIAPLAAQVADHPVADDRFTCGLLSKGDGPSASWHFVTTDAEGRFVLSGLQTRPYRVRSRHPTTGRLATAVDVAPGSPVEIVHADAAPGTELRGRVVAIDGQPLAGVRVHRNLIAFATTCRTPLGRRPLRMLRPAGSTTSDADGSFELPAGDRADCFLYLERDGVLARTVEPTELQNAGELTVTVQQCCPVEIALVDANGVDAVRFEDRDGVAQHLLIPNPFHHANYATSLPLEDGRCAPFFVGERAVRCVLLVEGRPVRRIDCAPSPMRTTLVQ